jgi:hypothetical protein
MRKNQILSFWHINKACVKIFMAISKVFFRDMSIFIISLTIELALTKLSPNNKKVVDYESVVCYIVEDQEKE